MAQMARYVLSGALIRAARVAAGLTSYELAGSIDRSESLVTLYELDYRQPPPEKLCEIADKLGVHVEDFFELVDEPEEAVAR